MQTLTASQPLQVLEDRGPLPAKQYAAERNGDLSHLVQQAQRGDRSAFAELYDRYADSVTAYVSVALSGGGDVQDVSQWIFERVLISLPRYEEHGRFEAWLFRIVRNCVIDHGRQSRRTIAEAPQTIARRADASNERGARGPRWGAHPELHDSLAALPPRQREVLVMRYVLDMTTEEIADTCSQNQEWVRQTKRRALLAINHRLASDRQID